MTYRISVASLLSAVSAGATAALIAATIVSCGSSDDNSHPAGPDASTDSGFDSSGDATGDRGVAPDGAPDADGATLVDGSMADAPSADADAVAPALDGPSDSGLDAGTADGPDGDASDGAASGEGGGVSDGEPGCAVPVPDAAADLAGAITDVVCQRWEVACGLTDASFKRDICKLVYSPAFGGWLTVAHASSFLDGGRIAYDRNAACRCLELNAALDQGIIGAATIGDIQTSCLRAYVGTSPLGDGGCRSSYECAAGGFCNSPSDGGLSTCMALEDAGAACTSSEMCDSVTNGVHGQYCDRAAKKCGPALDAGVNCMGNSDCASNYCLSVCQNGYNFGAPAICNAFTIPPDAGDGG